MAIDPWRAMFYICSMGVRTIGEAADARWQAFVACACGERAELDTVTLLWRSGRAMPLDLLPERLRCVQCGSREVRVTWSVPSKPDVAGGRYLIEQLDTVGEVVDVIARDRFQAGLDAFEKQVARAPGCRFVMRDGARVVRTWPRRAT